MNLLTLLWYGNIAGELFLLYRLFHLGLIRKYRFFVCFLVANVLSDIVLMYVPKFTSSLYQRLWFVTSSIVLIALVASVAEVFYHIKLCYRRIGSFASRVLIVALLIGLVSSLLLTFVEAKGYGSFLFILYRSVTSIFAVVLLCSAWVFLWVKTRIPRNTIWHCRILMLFCGTSALSYFSLHLGLDAYKTSLMTVGSSLLCFGLWIILLRRGGEIARFKTVSAEEGQEALDRLDDLLRWMDYRLRSTYRNNFGPKVTPANYTVNLLNRSFHYRLRIKP